MTGVKMKFAVKSPSIQPARQIQVDGVDRKSIPTFMNAIQNEIGKTLDLYAANNVPAGTEMRIQINAKEIGSLVEAETGTFPDPHGPTMLKALRLAASELIEKGYEAEVRMPEPGSDFDPLLMIRMETP